MNKTILAIMLVAMVSSTTAFKIDFEQCFNAAATFSHDIKLVIAETKAEKVSVERFLNATYVAAETFNPLLHACGVDLAFIDKIDSYTFNSTDDCFTNIDSISKLASQIFILVKEKKIEDLVPIVQDAIALFKTIKSTKTSCQFVPKKAIVLLSEGIENFQKIDILKCFQDAKLDLQQTKTFIQDFNSFKNNTLPIEDLFESGVNTYNDFVVTFRDCGVDLFTLPTVDNVAELKVCVKDVHEIGTQVKQVIAELKAFNIVEVINTLKTIGKEIADIKTTCAHKKSTKFLY